MRSPPPGSHSRSSRSSLARLPGSRVARIPLFRRAVTVYREHWQLFVGIGLIAIPIGVIFNVVQAFLIERQPLEFIVDLFDNTVGGQLTAVSLIGGVQQLAMLLFIAPAVVQGSADIVRGQRTHILRSYRLAASRTPAIALAFLILIVFAGAPLLLVIGLPITIWMVVQWHFFMQVLMFDKRASSRGSLRTSRALVRGQWWKTLFSVVIFDLLATIPGIVVGFGLLTLGRTAVGFANAASSVLYALTIPLSVIAVTLLYLDRLEQSNPSEFQRLTQLQIEEEPEYVASADGAIAPSTAP